MNGLQCKLVKLSKKKNIPKLTYTFHFQNNSLKYCAVWPLWQL